MFSGFAWSSHRILLWAMRQNCAHTTWKPEDTEPVVSGISKISGRGEVLYVNSRNPACAPSHDIRRCRSRDAHKHRLQEESTYVYVLFVYCSGLDVMRDRKHTCMHKEALKYFNNFWCFEYVWRKWICMDLWYFVITSSLEFLAISCRLPGWLFSRMRTAQRLSIPTTRRQI